MRLTIKNKKSETLGCWVAKTSRGFNKKQLAEIKKVRDKKDTFNMNEWAAKRTIEIKEEIDQLVTGGMKAIEAIALVLNESTLSNGIKETIRQDVLRKDQGFIRSCGLTFGTIS